MLLIPVCEQVYGVPFGSSRHNNSWGYWPSTGNLKEYRGLLKCKILPPQGLWLPLLSVHCYKEMVFPLCMRCSETESKMCDHEADARCLIGTWTMVEIRNAIELVYRVVTMYQLWSWKNCSDGVYKKYIDTFLNIKQESSGYPDWVVTPEDECKFKDDYYVSEGILLGDIEPNPGKRAFAKTMLNCLWGENAQCNLLKQT